MDRKTFREMPFLKKVEWILMYYGKTIVVVLTALFVMGLFIKSVLRPNDGFEFHVMILDDYCSKEAAGAFAKDLDTLTGVSCDVSTFFKSDPNQMQAFAVRLFSEDIDIVIAPEEQMTQLVKNGYLAAAELLPEGSMYYAGTGYSAEDRPEGLFIGYESEKAMNENVPRVKEYFTAVVK